MDKEKLDLIINKIANRKSILTKDIPNLDLYMDQIMTLFDTNLTDYKRYEDDKILTKTMINNYSKSKVITPVKGKKYNKEQIIQMLLIYQLKNNLSIQEIKELLTPFYEDKTNLEEIYNDYLLMKDNINKDLSPFINNIINQNNLDINNYKDQFLLITLLISISQSLTNIVELMIDNK